MLPDYLQLILLAQAHFPPVKGNHERLVMRIQERCILAPATGTHVAADARFGTHGDIRETVFRIDSPQFAHFGSDHVVDRIHHSNAPSQIGEQLHLRLDIVFETMMPLHMIGRDIQKNRRIGCEQYRGSKLIGRNLGHVHLGFTLGNRFKAGVPDIADCRGAETAFVENVGAKRGRGGFPVGAGDGHPHGIRGALPPSKFNLADDLAGGGLRGQVEVGEFGDSRGYDAQIEAAPNLFGIEHHLGTCLGEFRRLDTRLLIGGTGIYGHGSNPGTQKAQTITSGNAAALPKAKDEHVPDGCGGVLFSRYEFSH